MTGIIPKQTDPWWSDGASAGWPEPSRTAGCGRPRRAADRREAERSLLQAARDALERAAPLVGDLTVAPSHGARLALTRARIAAALFEIERLQARMGQARPAREP